MKRSRLPGIAAAALALVAPARADLSSYIAKPEAVYTWGQRSNRNDASGSVQELTMTSQTWQGNVWKHRIQVFRPTGAPHPEMCLLYNTGGNGGVGEEALGRMVANATGCTVAILFNIPNQPLYGKTEDGLIVYSWQKYVETGDEKWPLQFPMVKAVIKAMDTVQAAAKKAGDPEITKFVVTGASKRGWTSWLTAATGDKRIVAIAPMVIDMLNMPAQIPHQLAMYGKPSEMIDDYSSGGMLDALKTPKGKRIVEMVDPYSYRAKLSLPKMIVLGTNDPYWSQDALNLYWDDLTGPKWVLYTPNSGHALEDWTRVLNTLGAFARSMAAGKPLPTPKWQWTGDSSKATISISCDAPMKSARLFRAQSASTDFRKSTWMFSEIPVEGGKTSATATKPDTGFAATFVEMTFEQEGKPYTISTQMRILGAAK
ncbi:MAG TPA: PhoPQ-activated protein PqaA family protein [Armatimonadota bacterium]|jgi:PhoPQ-activated pathogenicity-related protein